MRFLFWLIAIPAAAAVACFAVANRGTVALELWPLPFVVEAPAFLPVLVAIVAGILLGGIAAWLSGGRARQEMRRRGRRIDTLEREIELMRRRGQNDDTPSATSLTARRDR
ncbi:MAG: LapA family protein [Alphaproteobacteria bacterium]